jgi:hypothetical protein
LQQARALIQVAVCVPPGATAPMRKYVNVILKGEHQNEHQYQNIETAFKDPQLRDQILERAKNEAKMFALRYGHLVEFADVVASIRKAVK